MDRFIHLPEFRVIICKEFKYAVLPSHITTHFAGKPHNLEVDERHKVADEVAEVNGLITNEEFLRRGEFPSPAASGESIEGLAAPKRGKLYCNAYLRAQMGYAGIYVA